MKHYTSLLLALFGCVLALPPAQAQYKFGSVSGGQSYNWDGIGMAPFRQAITNPAYFGPGGTVSKSAQVTTLGSITPASLSGINCFVSPALDYNQVSAGDINAVVSFFNKGGDLLLMDDNHVFDPIGNALGIPSADGAGTPTTGVGPLFNGPFGAAGTITHAGAFGQLTPAQVTAHGGTVVGTNSNGQVTVAMWGAGAYGPNSGKLVVATDVDMFNSNEAGYSIGQATYSPLNNNGRFALNTANFLISSVSTPEPGTLTLCAGIGLFAVLVARHRR